MVAYLARVLVGKMTKDIAETSQRSPMRISQAMIELRKTSVEISLARK